MLTQEQIKLMIESLEELQDLLIGEFSSELYDNQVKLLNYLKQIKN